MATIRTNEIHLEFHEETNVEFKVAEIVVSDGQPYENDVKVECEDDKRKKWKLVIQAGRHKTKDVADWFKNKIADGACVAKTYRDKKPDELNFALSGVMTLKKDKVVLNIPVVIAQGSIGLVNNWWIGTSGAGVSEIFHTEVLNCVVQNDKGFYYLVQFQANDNERFKLEYTSIAPLVKDISRTLGDYYAKLDEETDKFQDSETKGIILDAKIIKLPVCRQSHDFTCGVACVQSALRYAGYDLDTREDRLLKRLGSTPANGTDHNNIATFLNSVTYRGEKVFNALEWKSFDGGQYDSKLAAFNELWETLSGEFAKPVICIIQAWKDSEDDYSEDRNDDGHYVIAVGTAIDTDEKKYIIFMDPSTSGGYTYIEGKEFTIRWHDADGDNIIKYGGLVLNYKNKPKSEESTFYKLG